MTTSQDELLANIGALAGGCGWGRLPGECSYARRQRQANVRKDYQAIATLQNLHEVLLELEEKVERKQKAIDGGWRWYLSEIESEITDHREDIRKIRNAIAGRVE